MNISTATMMALVAYAHLAEGQLLRLRSIKRSKIWDFKSTSEGRQFLKEKAEFEPITHIVLFQTSTAMQMRSALFWGITQWRVVIPYRRFRTTYRSHLQGSRFLYPCRWDRQGLPLYSAQYPRTAQISSQVLIRKSSSRTPLLKLCVMLRESLTQHNTRRTPIVRRILSNVLLHNTTCCHSTLLI